MRRQFYLVEDEELPERAIENKRYISKLNVNPFYFIFITSTLALLYQEVYPLISIEWAELSM
jgi:hypothetical protein